MKMIVLTGIPGSGKSTFYKDNFEGKYVRVNLDTLKTRKREDKLIRECIDNNKSFVVDNTNVTVEQRKKYIDIAKKNNCQIINYFFPVDVKKSIQQNDLREGKAQVAKVAIYVMAKKFVKPSIEEGFNEVHEIK